MLSRGPIAFLVLIAWVATMATLVASSYGPSSARNLATDLARYGSTAVWRGVYYRGEKIGFTVSQTTRTEDGFELQEDGRLQMLAARARHRRAAAHHGPRRFQFHIAQFRVLARSRHGPGRGQRHRRWSRLPHRPGV